MKRQIPINITFDETKLKQIIEKIIERRAKKIINQVLKEQKFKIMVEGQVRYYINKLVSEYKK